MTEGLAQRAKKESLTLEILGAVEEKENLTQRHLAKKMGVALGLANSYLRRCIQKGLIKVKQAPANRYLYYLTPKGLTEKSRLTAEYLSSSFSFYRRSAEEFHQLFEQCRSDGISNVILCGKSELAEIAGLKAQSLGINIYALFELEKAGKKYLGKKTICCFGQIEIAICDLYLLTAMKNTEAVLQVVLRHVGKEKIYVPNVLKKYNRGLLNKYFGSLNV